MNDENFKKTHSYSKYRHLPFWDKIGNSYRAMMERCFNPNNWKYPKYGGRGITICDEWKEKTKGRIVFYKWAISNGYAEGLTIDRKDNDGNYTPSNCRWADNYQQANNKSNNFVIEYNGERKTIHEWSKISGVSCGTIRYRITHFWDVEKAIFEKAVIGRNQVGSETRKIKQPR